MKWSNVQRTPCCSDPAVTSNRVGAQKFLGQRRTFYPMRLIHALVAGSLLLAACSGSSSGVNPPDEDGTTTPATDSTTLATPPTTGPTDPTVPPEETTSTTETSTTESTTTSTTEDETTTTLAGQSTPTTVPPSSTGLVLSNTGIGPLQFGARPDTAVEFLAGALGIATADSDWGPSFSTFGTCPGTEVRGVTFGPLTVLFGDPDGEREFFAWTYNAFASPDLFGMATADGVGLGSTTDGILALHPDAEIFPANDVLGQTARFDGFFATFTDAGSVQHLAGGLLCGE